MGACLILAEGLRIWLQDEEAVLYGCGEWTEAAEREGHPGKFHHEGYWDYVDHVLLASGEYLLDGGGVYPREDAEGVARWWSEEFHPGYGVRPLADLSVSLEEEGIWDAPSVSLALAKLLEKEVGSGEVWREKLKDGLGLV